MLHRMQRTRWRAHLLVLAPGGSLLQRGDVPDRQTPGEVDDGQQAAVRTQAHAEHTVLEGPKFRCRVSRSEQMSVPSTEGGCHVKVASHLFIRVSGEEPEVGQPEEAPLLTLAGQDR